MTPGPEDVLAPVVLVEGAEPSLVADLVRRFVDEAAAGDESGMAVEDLTGTPEECDIGAVVDACRTPPFLTDRRVVVVRDVGRLRADQVEALVGYLADPSPTATLVLGAGNGKTAAALTKAVKAHGKVHSAGAPRPKDQATAIGELAKKAKVHLEPRALRFIDEHLGDNGFGRVAGLLNLLKAAFGDQRLNVEDVEPFLGDAGGVPTWDLTDAIDRRDTPGALTALARVLDGSAWHPLQVIATLHRHFAAMLRLDGSGVADEEAARQLLGLKSAFPAKKAMMQARKLGSESIARAIELVAAADLDVRGTSGLDERVVLEVLVARLSRLGGGSRPAARATSSRR